jgi:uncharacterized protein YndB with AHSA1/START domain
VTPNAYVHQLYIKTSADELWRAITQSAYTSKYFYGSGVESDWKTGSPFVYRSPSGQSLIEGTVLESDPGRKLVLAQRFLWDPKSAAEKPSRITYEIKEAAGTCRLTVTQDDFVDGSVAYAATVGGWPWIASGLKTVLETESGLPSDGPSA